MQILDAYEYRLQGRRPTTYAALGLGMALTYVNHATNAPLLAWVAVSAFLVLVLRVLATNRSAGLRLGRGQLEVFVGNMRHSVALARIRGAEITRGACLLHFSDGSRMALPRAALPPMRRLAEELRCCGVPVNLAAMSAAMPVLARR